jgi:Heavy metal associated domain 2
LEELGYQVVHAIAGRIRIRIPWLRSDADSVGKLQRALESLNFVSDVRVNPIAQSIVITYRASALSSQEAVERFVDAMQEVKPTPVATASPSSQPQKEAEEAVVQMAQSVAQTVTQTVAQVTQTLQSLAQPSSPATPSPTGDRPAEPPPSSQTTPSSAVESELPSPWDTLDDSTTPKTVKKPTPAAPTTVPVPAAESAPTANPPVQTELWLHSIASLAKRLNVSPQAISRRRNEADFSTWTQKQDPEGIAWSYDAKSQSFYPFTPFASPLEEIAAEPIPPLPAAPKTATSAEETARIEQLSETTGEAIGGVIGEVVGELLLGPLGAVVGEVMGENVGKQVVDSAKPADNAAVQPDPAPEISGEMSAPLPALENAESAENKPATHRRKAVPKDTGKQPRNRRSPRK